MTKVYEGFVLHNKVDNRYYTVHNVSYVTMGTGSNWHYYPRTITFAHVNFIDLINRGEVTPKNKNVSWDRRLFPHLLPYYHSPTPKYSIDDYRDRELTRGNMSSSSIPLCMHLSYWDKMYQTCVPLGEEFNPRMFAPKIRFDARDFELVPLFITTKNSRVKDIDFCFSGVMGLLP